MEGKNENQLPKTNHEQSNGKNRRHLGLGLMAGAGILLTVGNCIIQYIYSKWPNEVTTSQVLLTRSLIQLFFTPIFMICGRVHPYGGSCKNLLILSLMGVTEVIEIAFVYFALERMPLGDATVVRFTAPIFTLVFSFACLRKGCAVADIICGFVSFVGLVIMTRPTFIFGKYTEAEQAFQSQHHLNQSYLHLDRKILLTSNTNESTYLAGVAFALVAAMMLSVFFILNKIEGRKLDVTLTILYPSILGIAVSPMLKVALYETWFNEWTAELWVYMTVVGLLSFVGLMLMAEALQVEDAGPAILIRNLDVVYAFGLQFAMLNLKPDLMTLFGAAIVIFATSLIPLTRASIFKLQICRRQDKEEYIYRALGKDRRVSSKNEAL